MCNLATFFLRSFGYFVLYNHINFTLFLSPLQPFHSTIKLPNKNQNTLKRRKFIIVTIFLFFTLTILRTINFPAVNTFKRIDLASSRPFIDTRSPLKIILSHFYIHARPFVNHSTLGYTDTILVQRYLPPYDRYVAQILPAGNATPTRSFRVRAFAISKLGGQLPDETPIRT